jgi:plastocyanin
MQRFILGLSLAVVVVISAACSGGGSTPAPASPAASDGAPTGDAVTVVAKDIAFDPTTLTIPADAPTTIVLDNQEDVPHNIAIKDAAGTTVFKGEIVTKTKVDNAVPALPAGTYTFWCEVHPNMTGTLTAS